MPRHKSTESRPVGRPVRIAINDRTYEGAYFVNGPIVRVESLVLGIKSALPGGVAPDAFAKILLTELFFESEASNRS